VIDTGNHKRLFQPFFLEEDLAMKRRNFSLMVAGFIGVLCLGSGALAQASDDRLALKGYDPVAYFTEKRAMVGDAQHQHEWDGATYRFASAKHLAMFKSDPDRYLPQYKNFCAASVARGEKVHGNPEWWLVVDGRLYLFGKPVGPGMMTADAATIKRAADENWSRVSKLASPPLPDYMLRTSQPK
jgi:YHS domain-containing protein